MNVLFVTEYFPPKIMGGGEINLFLIAKALAKKGIKVNVLTSHFKGLKKHEIMDNIKVYRKLKTGQNPSNFFHNLKRSFIFPRSVVKEIKRLEIKFDLIHFIGTSIIAAKSLTDLNKPMVATIESYPALCPKGDRIYHGKKECKIICSFNEFVKCQSKSQEIGKMKNSFFLKYNPKFWIYIYNYYKKLNSSLKYCKIIAISDYMKKLLKQQNINSTVIPNSIDLSKFKPKNKKSINKKPNILYLGSLTRYKGPQILLKATKGVNCHIDLYGEGNIKKELKEIIKQNNLDAKIHKPIPYNKIPDIYNKADIVVFPSIWPEPFGRIPIEAMASGKPIIASDIGAISNTVKTNGILFKPGNIADLRSKLISLIKNKKLRQTLRKKGLTQAKKYTTNEIIKKLIQFYKKNKR